ncbi:MAG: ABC transporter ATP-binding protein [Nitrospirota bacterium]|nr:MAG: ABC transporter ATP-binding protein [Nitrospirota bacterium]
MSEIIRTIGLTKSFNTEAGTLDVLKGIDLKIERGDLIAITGASGAGKSTLLHILGTVDRPTSGEVLYSGRDVFGLDDEDLSSFRNNNIGFVFQFHHLLPEFSALENVIMPGLISGANRTAIEKKASGILSDLGVVDRGHHRPGELSGGEQQRVAVARALILDPDIVLADEPTGNLDTATGEELFSNIKELNNKMGLTFIIVTHNEALAKKCDRILHISDGIIQDR